MKGKQLTVSPFFMRSIQFNINNDSPVPRFQQLADKIVDEINYKRFKIGDPLPSVNNIIKDTGLSRDTIVKAYNLLKSKGIIESYPQKGYFVSCNTGRVFLFLDTFKAYKEVLYDSFYSHLTSDYSIDLHFHHYDITLFENLIRESAGKYSRYIIMNFDHPKVKEIIQIIDPSKLLVIDWDVNLPNGASFLKQSFSSGLERALQGLLPFLSKYERFNLIYPDYTYHPDVAIQVCKEFCVHNKVEFRVIRNIKNINPEKGELYLSVSDRALARLLDKANEYQLEVGQDIGIISYNETPMKKYIHNGITVVSTDFERMGEYAAEFVSSNKKMEIEIPTRMIVRNSI